MPTDNWLDMTISHESRTHVQCQCAIVYVLPSESDNWFGYDNFTWITNDAIRIINVNAQLPMYRESVKGDVRCGRRARVGVMSNLQFRQFLLIFWTLSYYILLNWNAPSLSAYFFFSFLLHILELYFSLIFCSFFAPLYCIFLNYIFPSLFAHF